MAIERPADIILPYSSTEHGTNNLLRDLYSKSGHMVLVADEHHLEYFGMVDEFSDLNSLLGSGVIIMPSTLVSDKTLFRRLHSYDPGLVSRPFVEAHKLAKLAHPSTCRRRNGDDFRLGHINGVISTYVMNEIALGNQIDPSLLVALPLHDTVEDTNEQTDVNVFALRSDVYKNPHGRLVNAVCLEEVFGTDVALIVNAMTKLPKSYYAPGGSYQELNPRGFKDYSNSTPSDQAQIRDLHYIQRFLELPRELRQFAIKGKYYDRWHNTSSDIQIHQGRNSVKVSSYVDETWMFIDSLFSGNMDARYLDRLLLTVCAVQESLRV